MLVEHPVLVGERVRQEHAERERASALPRSSIGMIGTRESAVRAFSFLLGSTMRCRCAASTA